MQMGKPSWLKIAVSATVPLLLFWFAYRIRADQKRTLVCQNNVNAVAFIAKGEQLAVSTGSMGGLDLWNVENREIVRKSQAYSSCRVEDQFFKQGALFARFSALYQMEILDVKTGKLLRTLDCKKEIDAKYDAYEDLQAGYLSNDGTILALATRMPPNDKDIRSNAKLRLWDLKTHQPICILAATTPPPGLKPKD